MTLFRKWPKTARLDSPFDITEKIDGTNAAVVILPFDPSPLYDPQDRPLMHVAPEGEMEPKFSVFAQSRTRLITPADDNFGFAQWVQDTAVTLVDDLGLGRHYGEWWGSKIQRGYGCTNGERYFSLFDAKRWFHLADPSGAVVPQFSTKNLGVVPVLAYGDELTPKHVNDALAWVQEEGSTLNSTTVAEGIVVRWWHDDSSKKYILDKP